TSDPGIRAVWRRKPRGVVAHGMPPRRDGVWREAPNQLDHVIAARQRVGITASRTFSGNEVRCHRNKTIGCQLIGYASNPIAEAKDFMNDQNNRSFVLPLRIDRPGSNGLLAAGNFYICVFSVTRRLLENSLGLFFAV